jgi:hypothetical protein
LEAQNQRAEAFHQGMADARREPRLRLDVDIRIRMDSRAAGVVKARAVDISESGIAALLKLEIPLGELCGSLPAAEPRGNPLGAWPLDSSLPRSVRRSDAQGSERQEFQQLRSYLFLRQTLPLHSARSIPQGPNVAWLRSPDQSFPRPQHVYLSDAPRSPDPPRSHLDDRYRTVRSSTCWYRLSGSTVSRGLQLTVKVWTELTEVRGQEGTPDC